MVELRWLNSDISRKLQYRQKIDATIRAGLGILASWNHDSIAETANYQWSDWHDVPEVYENRHTDTIKKPITTKCPRCGLDFNGPMGYVCPVADCPTGLGGAYS